MASPHVAGAVALFIEYYRGLRRTTRRSEPGAGQGRLPAVARDLAGNLDADGGTLGHPFDSKQGWGRMNLEAVLDPPEQRALLRRSRTSSRTRRGVVLDSLAARPGAAGADHAGLDRRAGPRPGRQHAGLEQRSRPGRRGRRPTYLGNIFGADGFSATGGAADFRNNTEGVFLPPGPEAITVRVVATNINSDGVPIVGDETDQDFALVCYNCAYAPRIGESSARRGGSSRTKSY